MSQAPSAAATAPVDATLRPPVAPSAPSADHGRWTVRPDTAATGEALAAAGPCSFDTVHALSGGARTACEDRLMGLARAATPQRVLTDPARLAELQGWSAYQDRMHAWLRSNSLEPRPCPPTHEPDHKLFVDHCALMQGALRFRYKF
jgi:hypothetical protein